MIAEIHKLDSQFQKLVYKNKGRELIRAFSLE